MRSTHGHGSGPAGEPVQPEHDEGPPEAAHELHTVGLGIPVEPEEWRTLKEGSEQAQDEPAEGQQDAG